MRDILPAQWQWRAAITVVTLIALLLRWYYVNAAVVIEPIRGDAAQYYAYAMNLVRHGVFSGADAVNAPLPDSYRDPAYPMFLAFWMWMYSGRDAWYDAVIMCQAVLGALSVTLIMQLGRTWLSLPWCVAAGVMAAVWPHSITLTGTLLTETLVGFLCVLGLVAFQVAIAKRDLKYAGFAGLVLGMAGLANAVLLPFGLLLALYVGGRGLTEGKVWRTVLIGALVLPLAWQVRNSQLPDDEVAHSSTSGYRAAQNFVQGANPDYHDAHMHSLANDGQAIRRMQEITEETNLLHGIPSAGFAQILARFKAHPLRYFSWYLIEKPWMLWSWRMRIAQDAIHVFPVRQSPFYRQAVMVALGLTCQTLSPFLAMLLLATITSFVAWHFAKRRWTWSPPSGFSMACLLVLYVTIVYALLQSEPRYAVPFRLFQMVLAASAGQALWSMWRESRSRRRAVADQSP